MQESYKSKFKEHNPNAKHCNKVIAALICDIQGQAHVAVICTGTHINYMKKCNHSPEHICDGHAESMCYEAAPIYFQEQMLRCKEHKNSIFTYVSKEVGYRLNPGVEFHLLVTEPPCGFIRENKPPHMWWKETNEHILHIPTCSSRILINAYMEIQGYASHFLEKSIFVKTITILFKDDNNLKKQTTTFDDEIVELPIIKVKKYDPEGFNATDVSKFKPMNLTPGGSCDQQTKRCNFQGFQHSYILLYTPNMQVGQIFFSYDSESGKQNYHSGIKMPLREIYGELLKNIDKKKASDRQKSMKKEYLNLKAKLNLCHQLKTYNDNLSSEITKLETNQNTKKEKLRREMENFLTDLTEGDLIKNIGDFRNDGLLLTKLKKASSTILAASKDESLNLAIIDCSWEVYFNTQLCFTSIEESTTDEDSPLNSISNLLDM